MSQHNYATQYIGKNKRLFDFHNVEEFVENVRDLDNKLENISKDISDLEETIDQINTCTCDKESIQKSIDDLYSKLSSNISCICNPEIIQDLTNRLIVVEDEIGADDGTNDKNINDIKSVLAGLKLKVSSNESLISSLTSKVSTNTTDIGTNKTNITTLTNKIKPISNGSYDTIHNNLQTATKGLYKGCLLYIDSNDDVYGVNILEMFRKILPQMFVKIDETCGVPLDGFDGEDWSTLQSDTARDDLVKYIKNQTDTLYGSGLSHHEQIKNLWNNIEALKLLL